MNRRPAPGQVTYDVRVYKTEVYKGKKVTTYWVRWRVAGEPWKEPFRKEPQADAFRSQLRAAASKGEAFSIETGRPVSWARTPETRYYPFARSYVDLRWRGISAGHRKNIARVLTATTLALRTADGAWPDDDVAKALMKWGFNSAKREQCPPEAARILAWLENNTVVVAELEDAALARSALKAATTMPDGSPMASATRRLRRAIWSTALEYAVELQLLTANPVPKAVRWETVKTSTAVDRRRVVNPAQARRLLAAVGEQGATGRRLVAFFGALYYAALRPEEAVTLREDDLTYGARGWGEFYVSQATPEVGSDWTDSGRNREDRRQLKHRAEGDGRRVPCPPPLTRLIEAHMKEFGTGDGGRLFTGPTGGEVAQSTYSRIWDQARKAALAPAQYSSLLPKRPYDLRHACVSTWLNGGVAPAQVAEWAGHTVEILLRTYARCLDGQDEIAKRRIEDALDVDDTDDQDENDTDAQGDEE